MSKFVLTERARVDIQQIWNHIAEDNINAADKVRNEFAAAMQKLAEMPGMGHRRGEVKNQRYRFWSVRSYLIAFSRHEALQIVRVVHGARDIKKMFRR